MSKANPSPEQASDADALGSRSLRTNVLYAVGGMGVFHACQFGVVVLLAKFAPPEVLGQLQFSIAVATPVVVFFSLELRGALIADAAGEFTFGTYRTLRFVTMSMAAVVLLGVGAWEYVGERNAAFTIILLGMCASKVVLSLAEIGWGLYQKRERLDLMAASACLRGVTMIVAFAVLVPLCYYLAQRGVIEPARIAQGAALAILTYALASLVILLTFDRRVLAARHDFDPTWTWDAVGRLARQTFPLGVVLVTLHLCNSVPQLVIERQADGKAALGHFGALATLTLVGNLLTFQAANAAANRLSSYFQFDLPAFGRLAGKLIAMAAAVGGVTLLIMLPFGEWLLRVLYRAEYAAYHAEFRIIVIAQCLALLTNVFGVLVTQMRLFWLTGSGPGDCPGEHAHRRPAADSRIGQPGARRRVDDLRALDRACDAVRSVRRNRDSAAAASDSANHGRLSHDQPRAPARRGRAAKLVTLPPTPSVGSKQIHEWVDVEVVD